MARDEKRVPPHQVDVPDYGKHYLRRLTLAEINAFLKLRPKDSDAAGYYLLAHSVVDESGNRLYKDEETAAVSEMDFALTDLLGDEILKVNKLRKEDKTPPVVAQAAKN